MCRITGLFKSTWVILFFLLLFLGLNLYLSYASVLVIYILYCTCSCSGRESRIPAPPAGHHWKEVRHDNTVTWLVSWTENIQGSNKYIMLNANSKLKVSYLLHNRGGCTYKWVQRNMLSDAADFGSNKVQTTLAAQFSNWFWKKLVSQIIRILTKINSYI